MMATNFLRDIAAGAVVLGILVLFHEWGHFIVAKLCGVRVDVFSIGFGPRLWGVKRGDTDYRVSALPLGGYVRMAGDNPVEARTGEPYEFLSRPRWQRFLIAIAGPSMNILVTFAILLGIFAIKGLPYIPPIFDTVQAGSPADKAGLKPGDTVISMDGKAVTDWGQLADGIHNSSGRAIPLTVRRDKTDVALVVTPAYVKNTEDGQMAWMIGTSRTTEERYERQGFIQAAKEAGIATVSKAQEIGGVLVGLFNGKVSVHDLAGPVGIVQLSGEAAKNGALTLLQLTALISLNLGMLNLLPIPILDGGHVLMLAIEGILRRDLSVAFKERFVQVGLVFLLGLFAFVMYSDILRVVQTHTR